MPPLPSPSNPQSYLSLARAHTVEAFDYALPASRIATHPLPDRSSSKLLVASRGHAPRHHKFADLPSLLPSDAMLVLNASRVIPARLHMRKRVTHGRSELLLLAPSANPEIAMAAPATGQVWSAYIGGRRVRAGDVLETALGGEGMLAAEVVRRDAQGASVRLAVEGGSSLRGASLAQVLDWVGETPLPPYIKRETVKADRETYQTVYAQQEGSVAAPTAGLHVTDGVLDELRENGVQLERVVLHVGAGTFTPIEADLVGGHVMHEEVVCVETETLHAIEMQIARGSPVVALGTTSVRTLESLYWFGVRLLCDAEFASNAEFTVEQWEPYERLDEHGVDGLPPPKEAINAIIQWNRGSVGQIYGKTSLLIVPGYPFKMLDALVTNFHQPRSTLLMLVSAFHGGQPEDLFDVYQEALAKDYRFLSYGDSSIYGSRAFFNRREIVVTD